MKRCNKIGGLHNFQPRYDEVENPLLTSLKVGGIDAEDMKSLMFKHIYVKDVCTWCGKEVSR